MVTRAERLDDFAYLRIIIETSMGRASSLIFAEKLFSIIYFFLVVGERYIGIMVVLDQSADYLAAAGRDMIPVLPKWAKGQTANALP